MNVNLRNAMQAPTVAYNVPVASSMAPVQELIDEQLDREETRGLFQNVIPQTVPEDMEIQAGYMEKRKRQCRRFKPNINWASVKGKLKKVGIILSLLLLGLIVVSAIWKYMTSAPSLPQIAPKSECELCVPKNFEVQLKGHNGTITTDVGTITTTKPKQDTYVELDVANRTLYFTPKDYKQAPNYLSYSLGARLSSVNNEHVRSQEIPYFALRESRTLGDAFILPRFENKDYGWVVLELACGPMCTGDHDNERLEGAKNRHDIVPDRLIMNTIVSSDPLFNNSRARFAVYKLEDADDGTSLDFSKMRPVLEGEYDPEKPAQEYVFAKDVALHRVAMRINFTGKHFFLYGLELYSRGVK